MTCEEVERGDVVDDYVLGRLEESRREAFEDHYFSCTACLERVRVFQELRVALAAQETGGRSPRWRRGAALLAAAAIVVLAVRVGQDMWSGTQDQAPSASGHDIVLPAPATSPAIELPPYTPPRLRASPTEAQRVFRDAMTAYTAGDCAGAMPGLRRALGIDGSLTQARYFLAACELHSGRVEDAVANLQQVIAAGESPYLEDAHFFLAKARIRQGDVESARQELRRVIALQGDRSEEAKRLLKELP